MKKYLLPLSHPPGSKSALFLLLISFLLFVSGDVVHPASEGKYCLAETILNNPESLKPFLEKAYQHSLDSGINNFYPFSCALIQESYKAIREKDYTKAILLGEYAEKLSPDLPVASRALAQSRWAQNPLLLHRLAEGYFAAFYKELRELESASKILSTTVLAAIGAFFLSLLLFCMQSLLRYVPLAFHDFKHLLPKTMPQGAAAGWMVIIFALPLLCNLSIVWAVLFWLLLMFQYQNKKERLLTVLLYILFMFVPWALSATGSILLAPQSPVIQALWKANYGAWGTRETEYLKAYSESHPRDAEILFTLGLIHKKENDFKAAERYYQNSLAIQPEDSRAHINLGNVYFAIKMPDKAIEEYTKAISLAPFSASAHFNLSRAYLRKFMFSESESALMKAMALDGSKISYYLTLHSENQNRLLIDEQLSRMGIWQKVFHDSPESSLLAQHVWDAVCRGIPFRYGWAVPMLLLLLIFISANKNTLQIAVRCASCGRSLCRRCHRIQGRSSFCASCSNVFEKSEGLDPLLKEKKMLDIKRHLKRQHWLATVLNFGFPGARLIGDGYPVMGMLSGFVFFFFLLKLLLGFWCIEGPWDFISPPSWIARIVSILLLMLFWLVFMRVSFRLKDDTANIADRICSIEKELYSQRQ